MAVERGRWGTFLALAAGVAALTIGVGAWDHGRATLAVAGAATTASLAVAGLAWARYRAGRDPRDLFVSAAFAVLTLQGLVFAIGWPFAHNLSTSFSFGMTSGVAYPVSSAGGVAATYAWQVGWVIAASLIVLGSPWEDRRGRAAPRPTTVFAATGLMLVSADVLLVWLARGEPAAPQLTSVLQNDIGVLGWVFAAVGAGLASLAAARTWGARFGDRPSRPWLTVAYLLAAALAIAVAVHPTPGTPFVRPVDLLGVVVPSLVFTGLLADQRTESFRQRRTTDRAEEVLGGRAEIASMIAHEVRGPAATVRGIASTSLTHYDRLSDDERREFLGMIEQESRRLMTTVDQMSLALKIDAGSLHVDLIPQDLQGIVRAGVEAVGAADGRVELDAEAGIMIPADRTRMIEVVRQLVDNAAKYSPAERPMRVRTYRDDGHAVLEVIDDGPGIPVEEREHVFTKFPNWRPNGYEERPGTGLGLFICRGLVAEHSGVISVEDGPSGGTMLRVRLPAEG